MAPPRPRWGYHQLERRAARRLVADAELPERSLVLDVGAGVGAITAPLVQAGHRVVAVELHPGRARRLEERFRTAVTVVRADAADLRLPTRPFHVVANPPHAITTALVRRLLHRGSRLQTAHLVIPEWAARRWTARDAPGIGRWSSDHELRLGAFVVRHRFEPSAPRDARVLVIERRR